VRWLGRLVLLAFALPVAIACGTVFLLFAAIFDPLIATFLGDTLWVVVARVFEAAFADQDPTTVEHALSGAGRLAMTILVAPPVFIALLSEALGLRRFLWHVGAVGLLTAAVPWLLSGMDRPAMPEEVHIATLLGLSGAVTGLVYWLLAGNSAGGRPAPIVTSPGS
jgi:hypothetical protein